MSAPTAHWRNSAFDAVAATYIRPIVPIARPAFRPVYRSRHFSPTERNAVEHGPRWTYRPRLLTLCSAKRPSRSIKNISPRATPAAAWMTRTRKSTSNFSAVIGAKPNLSNSDFVTGCWPSPCRTYSTAASPVCTPFSIRISQTSALVTTPCFGKSTKHGDGTCRGFFWDTGSKAARKCRTNRNTDPSNFSRMAVGSGLNGHNRWFFDKPQAIPSTFPITNRHQYQITL